MALALWPKSCRIWLGNAGPRQKRVRGNITAAGEGGVSDLELIRLINFLIKGPA